LWMGMLNRFYTGAAANLHECSPQRTRKIYAAGSEAERDGRAFLRMVSVLAKHAVCQVKVPVLAISIQETDRVILRPHQAIRRSCQAMSSRSGRIRRSCTWVLAVASWCSCSWRRSSGLASGAILKRRVPWRRCLAILRAWERILVSQRRWAG